MGKVIVKLKGGLGNQLFQYAAAFALSKEFSYSLSFDLTFFSSIKIEDIYRLDQYPIEVNELTAEQLEELNNILSSLKSSSLYNRIVNKFQIYSFKKSLYVYEHNFISIRKYVRRNPKRDLLLIFDDWFINPDFFLPKREFFQKMFVPNQIDKNSNQILDSIRNCNSVSVHIRRGDYIGNPYFNNLGDEYYIPAIELINKRIKNPVFYFFSNEPDYVRHHFSNIENKVVVDVNSDSINGYSTKGDVLDLFLMSNCKSQIIANSTFSWWGAFLNKSENTLVIAPKIWYKDSSAQKRYETGSLILDEWVKV